MERICTSPALVISFSSSFFFFFCFFSFFAKGLGSGIRNKEIQIRIIPLTSAADAEFAHIMHGTDFKTHEIELFFSRAVGRGVHVIFLSFLA